MLKPGWAKGLTFHALKAKLEAARQRGALFFRGWEPLLEDAGLTAAAAALAYNISNYGW